MAVTNLYPNLPGHLVEFKDGGLQLTSNTDTTASGKSLLILGTAFDGPVNEPVKIDATTVSQLFGSEVNENGYPNGATLTKYAKQAFKNGFTDIRCMRVTGSQASVTVKKDIVVSKEIKTDTIEGVIEGNAAVENITLSHGPLIANSVKVKTSKGAFVSLMKSYNLYNTTLAIAANAVSKKETLSIEYKYRDVNTTPHQVVETTIDTTTQATYTLTDIDTTNLLYTTDKSASGYDDIDAVYPITDGVKITVDGNVLQKDSDYTIAGNVVTFITSITTGETVSFEFYTYVETSATDSYTCQDTDQIVTLGYTPVAGTVAVTANGKPVPTTMYTVANGVINLTAGNFNVSDACVITYDYEVENLSKEEMVIRSIYGGSIYKKAKFQIVSATDDDGTVYNKFIFTKPDSKKYSQGEAPMSTTSIACPTVGQLKAVLKNAALNNVFEIICDDDDMLTADFPIFDSFLTDGGEDGVGADTNTMFEALSGKRDADGYLIEQGAYQILENYNVDYIYPAGVYADAKQTVNKNSSFHHELALLCAVLTYRTKMTHGFIDVKPNSNTTLVGIQEYVNKLLAYNNDHFMVDADGNDIVDSEGNKMDIGWYTSIVVGPEPVMISDTLGNYYGSPAIAYAALNAGLKPQSAPTNKALPGVKGMKFKFSNKQMNELVGNRMVVFKLKNEGTSTASSIPYVVDGCTAGNANSDYTRLSTVKVVTDVVDQIREVADPFIGEPNTIEQRNALSALISKRLSYLMEQGEIQYYEFEINATIQQVVLGECSIALTLVAPMELRKITTVVSLRAAA